MQGHHGAAGSHIRSGAKLLRETVYNRDNSILQHRVRGAKSNADAYAPLDVLARIFAVLDNSSREVRIT